MLTLESLFWLTLVAGIVSFWWQSDRIKSLAMQRVYHHCRNQNLQLLDQTMVLKGIGLQRDESGSLRLRRRYTFEFTSTGEMRHQGWIILLGNSIVSLELEPYIIPESDEHHL